MKNKFGIELKRLREDRQMTQEELAKALHVKRSTIGMYEQGNRTPGYEVLEEIADFFNVDINTLHGKESKDNGFCVSEAEANMICKYRTLDNDTAGIVNAVLELCFRKRLRIYTYYRHIAAAGKGFYFDDIPTSTIEAPDMDGADFLIGVSGDSMEPTFSDGDDLYVHSTNHINVGDIGIFIFEGECYVKELGEDGLISHNKRYPVIKGSDVRCVGKVLGKVQ